ncbi:PQQ-binding-like beta-propeller repeat protein [Halorubellus sp. JP-L1]|uniref:outer membrane protein assembly factor BamB family protein n=1 Tax=Halorubellus sp. JP-L1 TaxID=2715753 RepID=UPI00140D6DE4|nr:PQQ-binding-like beta-propeller repeat protein [Halorubellus sp. JP-L1]
MYDGCSRRDALAAAGALGTAGLAGCLGRLGLGGSAATVTSETATTQFRGGLERRGVHPDATVPTAVEREWTLRDVNTGDHTAAKASPVALAGGDVLVPGDSGSLWRVDADSGDGVWEASVTGSSRGVHGTPAVVDGVAYVGGYDGVLTAVDVESGDRVWRSGLGDAIGSSPAYHDGVVYIAVEYHDPSGAMFGVDAESGDVVWEDQRVTDHPHSTCAIDRDAGYLVVGANDGDLYAWTYPDLEFAWTFSTDGAIKGPVATYDGAAFFGSWDHSIYRVDLAEGTESWSTRTNGLVMSGPAVDPAADVVYVGSKDGRLYALSTDSGKATWEYDAGSAIIGCPVVTDEHVLVGSYDRTLHAVAEDAGDRAWTARGVGRVTSTPLVHDGAVYFADRASETYLDDGSGETGALYKLASGD